MRLAWTKTLEGAGIAFGYSNHAAQLRAALERNGVIFDENADVQLTLMPAGGFIPRLGKYNVLYTMFESTDVPPSWIPKIQHPDLIVVPCTHNKKVFERFTKVPIEVCLEGTKPDVFTYVERKYPEAYPDPTDEAGLIYPTLRKPLKLKTPFNFLWFGASNQRKGYVHTIYAWHELKKKYPEIARNCRLYMKTTQTEPQKRIAGFNMGEPIVQEQPAERVFTADNVTVDTRRVSEEALATMYHNAHCFLFPTMGEGFGLTLAEAMSTGMPCIYTPWSGPVDFCSSKEAYPLKFKILPVKAEFSACGGSKNDDYETSSASADISHIVRRMVQVYSDYDTALEKGKRAAERIRKEITWDISAKRLIEIINNHTCKEAKAC